jgi:hypothetical protein
MKSWEIIADNLSKAGWSLDYVSAIDSEGRTIWIADAGFDLLNGLDSGKGFLGSTLLGEILARWIIQLIKVAAASGSPRLP